VLKNLVLVGTAGMAGALARYGFALAVDRWWIGTFPMATFLINVLGSFAFGLVVGLGVERAAIGPDMRLALTTGFLGAFTTFSTFEFETNRLLVAGSWVMASCYVALSLFAGLAAVQIGTAIGRIEF
jgi:CrcB protein